MRRAVARGRVFPQSYSTDRRYGRLSLKAIGLFPLLWANADDQGRLCGDPEEVKYTCCPNIDHITKVDIPELLAELQRNRLIQVYETSVSAAIQLLDWWEIQRPQWAYPSEYPSPEGWLDHLRYHRTPTEVIIQNWVPPGQFERGLLPNTLPGTLPSASPSAPGNSQKEVFDSHPATSGCALPNSTGNASGNSGKGVAGNSAFRPVLGNESASALHSSLPKEPGESPSPLTTSIPLPPVKISPETSGEKDISLEDEEGKLAGELPNTPGDGLGRDSTNEPETKTFRSRREAEKTLSEDDREVISVWGSVKGFKLTQADASALVASLRTEFPEVDLLTESKRWAARKLSEPLKDNSRSSQQIWNWIEMARKFSRQRKVKGEKSQANRDTGDNHSGAFGQGPWYAGSRK